MDILPCKEKEKCVIFYSPPVGFMMVPCSISYFNSTAHPSSLSLSEAKQSSLSITGFEQGGGFSVVVSQRSTGAKNFLVFLPLSDQPSESQPKSLSLALDWSRCVGNCGKKCPTFTCSSAPRPTDRLVY